MARLDRRVFPECHCAGGVARPTVAWSHGCKEQWRSDYRAGSPPFSLIRNPTVPWPNQAVDPTVERANPRYAASRMPARDQKPTIEWSNLALPHRRARKLHSEPHHRRAEYGSLPHHRAVEYRVERPTLTWSNERRVFNFALVLPRPQGTIPPSKGRIHFTCSALD